MSAATSPRERSATFVATETTVVLGEDGRSEALKAGQTFVHDARHYLVATYPDLFRRVTAPRERPGRAVQQPPAPATPRRTDSSPLQLPRPWNPLVRLDMAAAPTFTVRIAERVYLAMGDKAYAQRGQVESGGYLFGRASGRASMTVCRTRPLERAKATRTSLRFDVSDVLREAKQMHDDTGEPNGWIGLWHAHPVVGDGQPSDADLRVFANQCRSLHEIAGELPQYVALILTPSWNRNQNTCEHYPSWARPTVHAWHMRALSDDQFVCNRALDSFSPRSDGGRQADVRPPDRPSSNPTSSRPWSTRRANRMPYKRRLPLPKYPGRVA
jgi:Prokaryotic homologs of the JAB domain